ncbi:uncharacterized protein BJ171DRAFT_518604 [Polychytrium aggregatum]|uniref:uncharacterized protein n=1 Tax=Polychytrium aggregatum TaxID=110093 RepID=UPI0022FE572D|nr:uncharacterized protein BJ171DRAFT_518604 [Polychytrium aggregatum]KAI9199518.1 hypothetical protein BJ171DRAFT_518604 [Polychytrium aggregatum]
MVTIWTFSLLILSVACLRISSTTASSGSWLYSSLRTGRVGLPSFWTVRMRIPSAVFWTTKSPTWRAEADRHSQNQRPVASTHRSQSQSQNQSQNQNQSHKMTGAGWWEHQGRSGSQPRPRPRPRPRSRSPLLARLAVVCGWICNPSLGQGGLISRTDPPGQSPVYRFSGHYRGCDRRARWPEVPGRPEVRQREQQQRRTFRFQQQCLNAWVGKHDVQRVPA